MIGLFAGGRRAQFRVLRRRAGRSVGRLIDGIAARVRRGPVPIGVRRVLGRVLVWQVRASRVPLNRILLGGQNSLSADEFARAHGNLLWPSTVVSEGPHADLLAASRVVPLSDEEILISSYADVARTCIEATGEFFSATDDDGILEVARDFLNRGLVGPQRPSQRRRHQSQIGAPILLARVRDSDFYQVVDGHHRLAAASVDGGIAVRARLRRRPVATPLQKMLDDMSWIGGERELYQPVSSPELGSAWTTVRRCTDRMASMDALLESMGVRPGGSSYLDVASCYGWFLSAMSERGFSVNGIERDPLAPALGEAVYGLDPSVVTVGEAVDVLSTAGRRWDVVSCFSLLHHFVLGRDVTDEVGLIRLLDSVTGRILFLDTGQDHEAWFKDSLSGWDADHVKATLEKHGTFDRVIDLGPDRDAVAPYADNYGRHLFACVRDR